jgi:hypothetical protein
MAILFGVQLQLLITVEERFISNKMINFLKIKKWHILILLGGLIFVGITIFAIVRHKNQTKLALYPAQTNTNYLYQSSSKGFAVYLGNRSSKQIPQVKFAVANSSIDFSPENNGSNQAKLEKKDDKSIIYKNVYPDVDLVYTLIDKGVKEEIIINNQQSVINNPQFTFKLNLKNAVLQKDLMNDSIITFVDSISGNYLFHFEKPFMIDAGGNRSDNVTLKIQRSSESNSVNLNDTNRTSFHILIMPDNNWLKTAIYPVVIDPTIVLDNADTVANWTSSDDTYFTKSQDTSDKQEGTGSIQVVASGVTDDALYFLKTLSAGDHDSVATKYENLDVEMEVKSGNQTISANTSWGNVTADSRNLFVRVEGNLTVNSSCTLTAQTRKRGMFIYVEGDLILNGTISMTARGASATGQQVLLLNDGIEYQISATGGAGAAAKTSSTCVQQNGGIGTAGSDGTAGGGGSGALTDNSVCSNLTSGAGGTATSYSGGAGGGGVACNNWGETTSAGSGSSSGGAGGDGKACYGRTAGGGAGNPGGGWTGSGSGTSGSNGTGGLIIIYATGDVAINSGGKIESKGSSGGSVSYAGGAGSGGGGINIFHKGSYTNSGSLDVSGGSGGSGTRSGGAGGAGSTRIQQSTLSANALNDTITRDLGAGNEEDLSDYIQVKYWIKSSRTGTYLQFGMGETAWDNNTTNVTINSANTWEEKTWDISGISNSNKDAIRYLGFKVTNADTDFTMKFDDIKVVNLSPTAPTSLLTEEQTNPSGVTDTTPEFSAVYNDDADDVANKYRIQVDDNSDFSSTIWDSGESGTAMSNCNQGNRCSDISYGGSVLTGNTKYYWRIKFWDEEGAEGDWSTEEAYFITSVAPIPPTSLLTEEQTNPTGVIDTTPEFSAVYNDDVGDVADYYQIQVDDDPAFGSTLWDSSKTSLSPTCTAGNRCTDISYGGNNTDLQWGKIYYWRIKYWDQWELEGAWSTESAYFTMIPIYEPTSCMIDDSGQPDELLVKWADNTDLETGYRIERSVDGGDWTLLSTEIAGSTSKTDNTVSSDHIYFYRIRANSDNGNSQWCATSQVDYSKGNLQMQGILVR